MPILASTTHENMELIKKIVMENLRFTIREVAEYVAISIGSQYAIFFEYFGLFVSKLLNFDQKNRRISIVQELLDDVNNNPYFLKRVINIPMEVPEEPRQKRTPRSVKCEVLFTVFVNYNCGKIIYGFCIMHLLLQLQPPYSPGCVVRRSDHQSDILFSIQMS